MNSLVIFFLTIASLGFAVLYVFVRWRLKLLQREKWIRDFVFPAALLNTLITKHHPQLAQKDTFLVARALREFFLIHARAGSTLIGMPSKVVDDLWHEFILSTRAYHEFCLQAFGHFFHHVPVHATPAGTRIDQPLRVTWRLACLEENISPTKPTRLPLLFAIDAKLQIVGGHTYNMDTLAAPPPKPAGAMGTGSGCSASACSGGSDGGGSGCCGDGGGGCGGGGCGGD